MLEYAISPTRAFVLDSALQALQPSKNGRLISSSGGLIAPVSDLHACREVICALSITPNDVDCNPVGPGHGRGLLGEPEWFLPHAVGKRLFATS